MNRKQYEDRLRPILEQSHQITQQLHVLMTDVGNDAGQAEWCWLYELSRLAGSLSGQVYNELWPRPSALISEETASA